ncbi:hypothetical protein C8R43DRAFT_1001899 [Mycena crocata]|nr:hypothetical protein C8R43DRAFT_1001899 [Mycena crocata]
MDWLSFPVEIRLYILSLPISGRDLGNLCLTCSQLLSITRPILYRHLTLVAEKNRLPNPAGEITLSLLARDADLAQSVRELTLDSSSSSETYFRNPGLVHIASLKNLTQLKRITIMGDISRHAGTQTMSHFTQILHDLELDELRIPTPGARKFLLALKPEQLLQLANAKRIELYPGFDYNDLLVPRLLTLLTAATRSLTSLSLTITSLSANTPASHPLFSLRFPLLRSLALRTTGDSENTPSPPGLTAFVSAHHQTLEDLHLGYTSDQTLHMGYSLVALLLDDAAELHPDFLPNMQRFQGHCRNVELMARSRMRCLSKLRELVLGAVADGLDPTMATMEYISRMLDALEAAGPLAALKRLDFDLFQWKPNKQKNLVPFVCRLAVLCGPTLEEWRGLLSSPFTVMDEFKHFPRIRVIHFPKHSTVLNPRMPIPDGDDWEDGQSTFEERLHRLAAVCSALEEVQIVGSTIDDPHSCWKVDRRTSGIALRCMTAD